jgi:putative transposase
MAVSCNGAHCPHELIRMGGRWYVAYPLSPRRVEAWMLERGVHVDHATMNRWGGTDSPLLDAALQARQRPVWISWRRADTSITVKGEWRYR